MKTMSSDLVMIFWIVVLQRFYVSFYMCSRLWSMSQMQCVVYKSSTSLLAYPQSIAWHEL